MVPRDVCFDHILPTELPAPSQLRIPTLADGDVDAVRRYCLVCPSYCPPYPVWDGCALSVADDAERWLQSYAAKRDWLDSKAEDAGRSLRGFFRKPWAVAGMLLAAWALFSLSQLVAPFTTQQHPAGMAMMSVFCFSAFILVSLAVRNAGTKNGGGGG